MNININALNANLNSQRIALICCKNAGLVSEKEYEARNKEIQRLMKLNNRILRQKDLSQDSDVVITTNYSI